MIFAKLAVGFLLIGLGFHHLISNSVNYFKHKPLFQGSTLRPPRSEIPNSGDSPANETPTSHNVAPKCDIFRGNWVPDLSPPPYTNQSCRLIQNYENCMKNGRTDTGYLHWRWNPLDCELPKFNPTRFLNMMRHKSLIFIGDSITRDHVGSLLCTLSQAEQAVEIYHDKDYKSMNWSFPSHNFTVAMVWSPFLGKAHMSKDKNGVSNALNHLHLDKPNPEWTEQFDKYDYVVVATGTWFSKPTIYYENNKIMGCHTCPGMNITDVAIQYAYRKVLSSIYDFFTSSNHKPHILYRTISPDHIEYEGQDNSIVCNRTVPYKEGKINMTLIVSSLHNIELDEFKKAEKRSYEKGVTIKLLDTTHASLLRPDGHPGVYRNIYDLSKNAKVTSDCLHWCLPGPIDTWNSLMMEKIIKG